MKKPVIAIPIGDPAGVGPEIVAKSIASDEVFQIAVCVIVGDRKILENLKKYPMDQFSMHRH